MKKLLAFLALVSSANAEAQSKLRVRLTDNTQIHVAVNGRYFPQRGTTITIGDLPPGRHSLKIYSTRYDRWGKNYEKLAFNGMVRTVTGMVTNFTYSPYTYRVDMQRQNIDDNAPYNPANNQYNDNEQDNTSLNDRNAPPTANDGKYTPPASPVASPVPADELGTFTEKDSEKLKAKVAAKNTDTEKLKLLKDELKKETLSTLQVSYIMDWFLFESTKVEFAKWAYPIAIDKENYKSLSGKFSYKSSQEELNEFLKDK